MVKKTSKYRGVSYTPRNLKNPWKAQFEHQGVRYNVGAFPEERIAAAEVDKARIRVGLDPVNIFKKKNAVNNQ